MDYDLETHAGRVEALEEMVDKGQLANVLDALAEVCHHKAAHLDSAWDDVAAAGRWEGAAAEIEELSGETAYPWIIHRTGPRLV